MQAGRLRYGGNAARTRPDRPWNPCPGCVVQRTMTADTLPMESLELSPLAALRCKRRKDRSPGALALSIAIHAGFASVVLLAAQGLAPPAMKRTATILLPLAKAGSAPPEKKGVRRPHKVKKAAPPQTPVKTRVPTTIPVEPPKVEAPVEPSSVTIDGADSETGPIGAPDGSVDGVIDGHGDGAGVDSIGDGDSFGIPTGREIVDVPPSEAHLLKKVAPIYPVIARKAQVQGTVVLVAVIGTDGTVEDLKVRRSIPLLDQAAMDAVRQWLFEPARRDGRPVRMRLTVSLLFRLTR